MLKQFKYREKVSSKIKAIPRKQRVEPKLEIGRKYYVSFGNNWAYPCILREIIKEFERTEVKIHIRVIEKEAFYRKNGTMIYDPFEEHQVYANEIGHCPEDAVRNSL